MSMLGLAILAVGWWYYLMMGGAIVALLIILKVVKGRQV